MDNEHETWLASLKEGDEVAVQMGSNHTVTNINRITPTRIIKTKSGDEFKKGCMKTGAWDHNKYLVPVTQEIKDEIRRKYLIKKIDFVPFHGMTLDQLERINAILEEANNRDYGK